VGVVLLHGPDAAPYAPTIPLDQAEAARCAAEYLIGRGYRRLACLVSIDSLLPTITCWRDRNQPPEAVYAYNDEFALILIQALREVGLEVPHDLAAMGSGNLPVGSALRPTLSSTYSDMPAVARVVASSIRRLLDDQDVDPEAATAVQPRLIVRESA
jgi:DNA-binding LacI/PurR family transcriptional regulator